MYKTAKKSGFTLVELLVTVSIISLLSAIIMVSFSGSKKSSLYLKRLSDINQIQNAITRYNAAVGFYPTTSGTWRTTGTCAGLSSTATTTGYVPSVVSKYIPSLPIDPSLVTNCTLGPMYAYRSDGRDYKLIVYNNQVDKASIKSKNSAMEDPARLTTGATPSFGFWTSGATAW